MAQGLGEGELDRCVLYTYRLAVTYANHNGELPADKQNWWDWKD
ncbi:helix-hairpin-helix domain-containing protein [Pseudolactococcus chungangensis]